MAFAGDQRLFSLYETYVLGIQTGVCDGFL
jgi:hypothetical protein